MAYHSTYDHKPYKLIEELTEALTGSVPRKHHTEVLAALNRCREMIGQLAAVLVHLDKEQKHGELMLEAKLYANILSGYFETVGRDFGFRDIKDNFDPREYLKDKGVIRPDLKEAAARAEERARELRAERNKEIDDLISQVISKPKRGRGRPPGVKNKPKDVLILPSLSERPVHKRRTNRGRKVGSKNKAKGASK